MKYLFTVAILLTLAQHPVLAGGGIPSVNAGWLVGQLVHGPFRRADKTISNNAAPKPVAINSASAVFALDQATIFIDPVGPQDQFRPFGRPDIVVLTRARPSHLSVDTMIGLLRRDTVVLAPQAVIDQLPLMISNNVISPFETGTTQQVYGITFRAFPASAPIPFGAAMAQRDRGNIGVLMEVDGARVYF